MSEQTRRRCWRITCVEATHAAKICAIEKNTVHQIFDHAAALLRDRMRSWSPPSNAI
jgi:hypothetical protein